MFYPAIVTVTVPLPEPVGSTVAVTVCELPVAMSAVLERLQLSTPLVGQEMLMWAPAVAVNAETTV